MNRRASLIHPQLAERFPDLAFSFLRSGIPDEDIQAVTHGIWRAIENGQVQAPIPGAQVEGTPPPPTERPPKRTPQQEALRPVAQSRERAREQLLGTGPLAVIPNSTQSNILTLAPQYRGVAMWLAQQTGLGSSGFGLRRVQGKAENDPTDIANLVLYAKPGLVVLRSSVMDMFAKGMGTPAKPATPAGAGRGMSTGTPAIPAVPPNPNDPDFIRAQAIIGIIKKVYPDANIEFQSGGILGTAFTGATQVENLAAVPITAAAQRIHIGDQSLTQVLGAEEHLFGLAKGPTVTTHQMSIGEIYQMTERTSNLAFGKDLAYTSGLKPTDPGYGPFVNATNFIADWYLNPLIVAGKIGAGVKLAREVPTEVGAAEAAKAGLITRVVYGRLGRSAEALVTQSPQGVEVTNQIWDMISREGTKNSADALRRTFGMSAEQAKIIASARDPAEVADLLVQHFKGLTAGEVNQLETAKQALTEQRDALRQARDHPPEGGLVSDIPGESLASVQAELDQVEAKLRFNPVADSYQPFRRLPQMRKTSKLFKSIADSATPGTRWAKFAEEHLLNPTDLGIKGTRINLSRLFQPIVGKEPLRVPLSPIAQRGDLEKFTSSVDAMLQDFGVPLETRSRIGDKIIAAKTQQEIERIMLGDVAAAVKEESGLPGAVRQNALQWFNSFTDRYWGVVDKTTTNVAGNESTEADHLFSRSGGFDEKGNEIRVPQPYAKVHLADHFYLPDHEGILDITGAWRRMVRGLGNRFGKGDAFLHGWHNWQRILDGTTRLWKDAILLGRAPAVFLRTYGEESTRAAAAGMASIVNRPWEWIRHVVAADKEGWELELANNAAQRARLEGLLNEIDQLPGTAVIKRAKLRRQFVQESRDFMSKAMGMIQSQLVESKLGHTVQGLAARLDDKNPEVRAAAWEGLRAAHYQWSNDVGLRAVLKSNSPAELLDWARGEEGSAYVTDMADLWNGYMVPPEVTKAEEGTTLPRTIRETRLATGQVSPQQLAGARARIVAARLEKLTPLEREDLIEEFRIHNPHVELPDWIHETEDKIIPGQTTLEGITPPRKATTWAQKVSRWKYGDRLANVEDEVLAEQQRLRNVARPKVMTTTREIPGAHVGVDEIGGVSVPRLRYIFDRLRQEGDHISGGDRLIKQGILDGGFVSDRMQEVYNEARDTFSNAQQMFRDAEEAKQTALDMAEGPEKADALHEADIMFRQAMDERTNAKQVAGQLGIGDREMARIMEDPSQLSGVRSRIITPITEGDGYTEYLQRSAKNGEWTPPTYISTKINDIPNAAGVASKRGFRSRLYEYMLGGPEGYLSRKPLFRMFADERYKELRALGWDDRAAKSIAARDGAQRTRDLLYDLSERTSAQHWARHLAPFLPAWEEILKTWAWQIPGRRLQGIGQVYLATRVHQLLNLLGDLGIDPNSPIAVGPLGWILNQAINGGGVGPQYIASFKAKDLNMVSQSVLPGLGPVPSAVLGRLAKDHPIFDGVAKFLMPYGFDVQLGPVGLNRIYEGIARRPPPWEFASPEYQDQQYAFAKNDAIRHASAQLAAEGITPPGVNATKDEIDKYTIELTDKANHDLRMWYLIRGAYSMFFPAPLTVTDTYKRDISQFYAQTANMVSGSPAAEAAWNRWLIDHPWGEFYRAPGTVPTQAIPEAKFSKFGDQATFEEIRQNYRKPLSPDEFIHLGLLLASRQQYNIQIEQGLAAIGPTNADLARNWYKRGQVLIDAHIAWDNYTKQNPTAYGMYQDLIHSDHPTQFAKQSFALDQLGEFYRVGRELSKFTATFQLPQGDLNKVLGEASAALAKANTYSDGRYKGLDWYFTNVVEPHYKQSDKLWNEARYWQNLESPERPDAYVHFAAIMNRIRSLNVDAKEQTGPDGEKYPTPEEFSWGNLPQKTNDPTAWSQESKVTDWITYKPEWLTPFQMKQVGYPSGRAANAMAEAIGKYDQRMSIFINAHHVSTSSNEFQSIQDQRQKDLGALARRIGPGAVRLWQLSNSTTSDRLIESGWTSPSSVFGATASLAHLISDQITAQGYSPSGSSQFAIARKKSFYSLLDHYYRGNSTFQAEINELQRVLSKTGLGDPAKRYAVYAAVYFDDFGGL